MLTVADVERLHAAGGRLLVSPNVDPAVLARAADFSIVTMPGVFTPTEAFLAIKSGASALKFFPASVLGAERHCGDRRGAAEGYRRRRGRRHFGG